MRLASDHTDCGEPEMVAGGGGRANVVGVRAAEGQQRAVALFRRRGEVVLQLPPLVPRQLGMSSRFRISRTPARSSRSSDSSVLGEGSRRFSSTDDRPCVPTRSSLALRRNCPPSS